MKYLMVLSLILLSSSTFASTGGGFGNPGNSGRYTNTNSIDQVYEAGKKIYTGRNKAYGKLKFCVVDSESTEKLKLKLKLKRSTLKPYKGKSLLNLLTDLYNCDMPEQQIINILSTKDMYLILYYLNKRYKLKLVG